MTDCTPVAIEVCQLLKFHNGDEGTIIQYRCANGDGSSHGYLHREWHYGREDIEILADYYGVPIPRWAYATEGTPTKYTLPESLPNI